MHLLQLKPKTLGLVLQVDHPEFITTNEEIHQLGKHAYWKQLNFQSRLLPLEKMWIVQLWLLQSEPPFEVRNKYFSCILWKILHKFTSSLSLPLCFGSGRRITSTKEVETIVSRAFTFTRPYFKIISYHKIYKISI